MIDRQGHIVLTDFGLSKIAEKENSIRGTLQYLPPENLEGKTYGKSCDIWALGVLFLEMLVGF